MYTVYHLHPYLQIPKIVEVRTLREAKKEMMANTSDNPKTLNQSILLIGDKVLASRRWSQKRLSWSK